MKIDTAGNYTLRYTAEDECGNETVVDRNLVVAPPRTVLYADGAFIINELPGDRGTNEALHGVATNEYPPFDPNGASNIEKYIFQTESDRPWHTERRTITSVAIGSNISPTDMTNWFYECYYVTTINLDRLDSSSVTAMLNTFNACYRLVDLDVGGLDTSNVTSFRQTFGSCRAIKSIDVSNFDTSNATDFFQMFVYCEELQTILVSTLFDVSNATDTNNMFLWDTKLKGGSGTVYDSSQTGGLYARIDNPPDAPGYFTLKPTT